MRCQEGIRIEWRGRISRGSIQSEVSRTDLRAWQDTEQAITNFLDAFESQDIRQQKAYLQTILKSAWFTQTGGLGWSSGNSSGTFSLSLYAQ